MNNNIVPMARIPVFTSLDNFNLMCFNEANLGINQKQGGLFILGF
jgi:hypothetical protein